MRYEAEIRPVRVSFDLGKLIFTEESCKTLTRELYWRSRSEIERGSKWWISSFDTPEEILEQIEYLEEYHLSTNNLIQHHYADCVDALKEYRTAIMEETVEKLTSLNKSYFKARESLFNMNTSIDSEHMADFNGVKIKVSKRHIVEQTENRMKECQEEIKSILEYMAKLNNVG